MNLQRILVGPEVVAAARSFLGDWFGLSLASFVHQQNRILESARFVTWLSDKVSQEDALDFQMGGKVDPSSKEEEWHHLPDGTRIQKIPNTKSFITEYFASKYKGSNNFVLSANWESRPNEKLSLPSVFYGDEVYNFAPVSCLTQYEYRNIFQPCLKFGASFLIQGLPVPISGALLSRRDLENIAKKAIVVVFLIYDNESHLVCEL